MRIARWRRYIRNETGNIFSLAKAFIRNTGTRRNQKRMTRIWLPINFNKATQIVVQYKGRINASSFALEAQERTQVEQVEVVVSPKVGNVKQDVSDALNTETNSERATAQKNTVSTEETGSRGGLVQRVKALLSNAKTEQQRKDAISNMSFGETSAAIENGMVSRAEIPFAIVSNITPQILVDRAGAQNLPIIMDYSSVYLAAKKAGDLPGHYHDLGADIMAEIPNNLNTPTLMVKLENGRINEVVQLTDKNGNPILVSLELSTVKNLGGSFKAYNLMLTAFGAKSNYINKLISNPNNKVLVNNLPGATSQVNPRLNKLPGVVNEAASGSNASTPAMNAEKSANTFTSEPTESVASEDISSITSISTVEQHVKRENAGNAGQGAEKERGFSANVRTDDAVESEVRLSFEETPETMLTS